MLFQRATTYGILALIHMAEQDADAVHQSHIIARETGVPVTYLRRLLGRLERARVLSSRRGYGGGYKLARPPREISLLQIVEAMEGQIDPVWVLPDDLVSGRSATARGLQRWRQRTASQVRAMLEETTLGDITR